MTKKNDDGQNLNNPKILDEDVMIKEKQLSEIIGNSCKTLQRWRNKGIGPLFIKTNGTGRIYYQIRDVIAWLNQNRFKSTSEYTVARMKEILASTDNDKGADHDA